MSSIKHTVYGLFRQFSSTSIQYPDTSTNTPSSNFTSATIQEKFQNSKQMTVQQTSIYESLPRNRRKKSLKLANNNADLSQPDKTEAPTLKHTKSDNMAARYCDISSSRSGTKNHHSSSNKSENGVAVSKIGDRKNRPNSLHSGCEGQSFIANYLAG